MAIEPLRNFDADVPHMRASSPYRLISASRSPLLKAAAHCSAMAGGSRFSSATAGGSSRSAGVGARCSATGGGSWVGDVGGCAHPSGVSSKIRTRARTGRWITWNSAGGALRKARLFGGRRPQAAILFDHQRGVGWQRVHAVRKFTLARKGDSPMRRAVERHRLVAFATGLAKTLDVGVSGFSVFF